MGSVSGLGIKKVNLSCFPLAPLPSMERGLEVKNFMNKYVEISILIGKTITDIQKTDNSVLFTTSEGENYKMYHEQDCCEGVGIEDIIGDLDDLLNSPILKAEEVSNANENPEGVPAKDYQDSWTWTFYNLATIKGYVTIRWYGESNGYYSESVDFVKL